MFSFTFLKANEISDYTLTDTKGKTYSVHELLEQGHYIALFFTSNT